MARRKNPITWVVLLALLGFGSYAGWNSYQAGEFTIQPKELSRTERLIRDLRKEIRRNEKRIKELESELLVGMRGTPRDEYEQEIEELKQRNEELRRRIGYLED